MFTRNESIKEGHIHLLSPFVPELVSPIVLPITYSIHQGHTDYKQLELGTHLAKIKVAQKERMKSP